MVIDGFLVSKSCMTLYLLLTVIFTLDISSPVDIITIALSKFSP